MQTIIIDELWRYWSGIAPSQKGWITNTTINTYENHTNYFSLNLICNEGISDHTWKSAKQGFVFYSSSLNRETFQV